MEKGKVSAIDKAKVLRDENMDLYKSLLVEMNSKDINLKDEEERTLLHFECSKKDCSQKLMEIMIAKGASVTMVDKRGKTCLHHLLENVGIKPECLQIVLGKNPNVNLQDKDFKTPLDYAVSNPNFTTELMTQLFRHKVDPNLKNPYGRTSFMFACFHNRSPEILEALISNGANPKFSDKFGNSCIYYLCANENPEPRSLAFLLSQQLEVNSNQFFRVAFEKNELSTVLAFLRAGFDCEALKLLPNEHNTRCVQMVEDFKNGVYWRTEWQEYLSAKESLVFITSFWAFSELEKRGQRFPKPLVFKILSKVL